MRSENEGWAMVGSSEEKGGRRGGELVGWLAGWMDGWERSEEAAGSEGGRGKGEKSPSLIHHPSMPSICTTTSMFGWFACFIHFLSLQYLVRISTSKKGAKWGGDWAFFLQVFSRRRKRPR